MRQQAFVGFVERCHLLDGAELGVLAGIVRKHFPVEFGAHEEIVRNCSGLAVAAHNEDGLQLRPLKLKFLNQRSHILVLVMEEKLREELQRCFVVGCALGVRKF